MDSLTPELIATLAVGVALAGLILRQGARLDGRIGRLDGRIDGLDGRIDRLEGRIDRMNERIEERLGRLEQGQADLRVRMAKLEWLREAITGKRAA